VCARTAALRGRLASADVSAWCRALVWRSELASLIQFQAMPWARWMYGTAHGVTHVDPSVANCRQGGVWCAVLSVRAVRAGLVERDWCYRRWLSRCRRAATPARLLSSSCVSLWLSRARGRRSVEIGCALMCASCACPHGGLLEVYLCFAICVVGGCARVCGVYRVVYLRVARRGGRCGVVCVVCG